MENIWKEFKEFIMQGNVLDLAVGVVMGAAFTAIVNSLVDQIITPIIAGLSGNASVEDITIFIGPAELGIGAFLQSVIDFLVIAAILFLIIKGINTLTNRFKKEEADEIEAPAVEAYLEEIRDILAANKSLTAVDSKSDENLEK